MAWKKIQFVGIAVIGLGALAFLYSRVFEPRTFPLLPPGAYLGSVSGFGVERDDRSAFYLERLPDSNVFIAVVFADAFRPQALQGELAPDHQGYLPLTITKDQTPLLFSGAGSGSSFQGKIHVSDETIGRWSLAPIQTEQLMGKLNASPKDLSAWLEVKSEFRSLRRAARLYQERARDAQAKKEKLARFVEDEGLLRERAAKRRDSLASELGAAVEERKQTTAMLQELVGQLELVGRISKTGQAILLARRVANRENQWYQANWQNEEGSDFLEENLGPESAVDFQKLESAVRSAEEIQGLLRERESEKKKIQELEAALSSGVEVIAPPNEDSSGAPVPEGAPNTSGANSQAPSRNGNRQSLWDKLFN